MSLITVWICSCPAPNFDRDGETLYYPEFDAPATNHGEVYNDDDESKSFMVKASIPDFSLIATRTQRDKGVPTAPWGTLFGNRGTRDRDILTLIGLTYQHDFEDDLSILGRLSYNHYDYLGDYVYDDGGVYTSYDAIAAKWWVGEIQLSKQLTDRYQLTAGLDSQYNVQQDQKTWDSELYLDDHESSKSWGIYVQDEFRVLDNLTLVTGLRRDAYESTGSTVNPRAALIYEHSEDTVVKLLAGKAFRAPSVYELYYEDGGYTTKANPDLEPETIKTEEALCRHRNQVYQ